MRGEELVKECLTEAPDNRLQKTIDFRAKLMKRLSMDDIHEIAFLTQGNDQRKQQLFDLLSDPEEKNAYQAAWVFTHFTYSQNEWLYAKQDILIDEVMTCKHSGTRRLLLTMLYRQPMPQSPRVDFLDYCFQRMLSRQEPIAIQGLAMKLVYELCRPIPELLNELKETLGLMKVNLLSTAVRTARKNVLKAMESGKSMQSY